MLGPPVTVSDRSGLAKLETDQDVLLYLAKEIKSSVGAFASTKTKVAFLPSTDQTQPTLRAGAVLGSTAAISEGASGEVSTAVPFQITAFTSSVESEEINPT